MELVSGNIFIRSNRLARAGEETGNHTHHFDHTTVVYTGGIYVERTLPDGAILKSIHRAPDSIGKSLPTALDGIREGGYRLLIRADVKHRIVALYDHTVFDCIYAHRTPQGDVIQEYDGWTEAYN